jgi:hypothetical protein
MTKKKTQVLDGLAYDLKVYMDAVAADGRWGSSIGKSFFFRPFFFFLFCISPTLLWFAVAADGRWGSSIGTYGLMH